VTPAALALVVGAAILHATWNALAKQARTPLPFLWASVSLASLVLCPVGLWIAWRAGGVPAGAWPFVAATVLLHALYFYALGRAYRHGDFSRVYPIARGLGVALVPALAWGIFDERLSGLGALGVFLVVTGIVAVHRVPAAAGPVSAAPAGAGTFWAVLTGLTIAAYSLVDKAGVARLNPVPYIALLGLGSALLLAPAVLRDPEALRREWAVNRRAILVAAALNLTAYLLVLFAFRLSKVGYVVAARELSIVLSAFIGSWWLGEGRLGPRLAGAAVILAGVVCVALAR
jgi:drug/metabolite transporter (DMT)-like permease